MEEEKNKMIQDLLESLKYPLARGHMELALSTMCELEENQSSYKLVFNLPKKEAFNKAPGNTTLPVNQMQHDNPDYYFKSVKHT